MASSTHCLILMLLLAVGSLFSEAKDSRKVYVVHVNGGSDGKLSMRSAHMNILEQVLEKGRKASESLIYSYKESLTGFAARLTDEEREKMKSIKDVLSVEPSRKYKLQTTRSWDFIGFPTNINRAQVNESDLIVGVIDSGIWPHSESFNDDELGPPPSKWKGACQNITCNNKIIGARTYYTGTEPLAEEISVVDIFGHGTHVASIAAGAKVNNANFFGLGRGIARGGVPSARIAVYKVSWKFADGYFTEDQDVMAAIDDAIQDGVDIISVSLVFDPLSPYDDDNFAIGAFRAMKNGKLVCAAAGNWGPEKFRVSNVAPWILTVGASSTDRKFVGEVELGNGQSLYGNALNAFQTQSSYYPLERKNFLLIEQNRELFVRSEDGNEFRRNTLEAVNVNAITPFTYELLYNASNISAIGLIGTGPQCNVSEGIDFPLPGVCLDTDLNLLMNYYNGARNPVGKIKKSKAVFDPTAPVAASFSSRGPSNVSPDILKPDISAPGVDILAAWPSKVHPTLYPGDERYAEFNIKWGTSMACPHVTASAVYVKEFHLSWSPAAIKSALMTTATPMSRTRHPEAELAYGAGQVNPVKALDPGLIYDITADDYVKFLCADGYSVDKIKKITGDNSVSCSGTGTFTTKSLNYPSMSAKVAPDNDFKVEFYRTVTNVGSSSSVYNAETDEPLAGLRVDVNPPVLNFKSLGEKLEFSVVVSGEKLKNGTVTSAELVWSDEKHRVRSPILIYAW